MNMKQFPVIDPIATGKNIIRLRAERGMSVRDLQAYGHCSRAAGITTNRICTIGRVLPPFI